MFSIILYLRNLEKRVEEIRDRNQERRGRYLLFFREWRIWLSVVTVKCASRAALRGKPWQFILTTDIKAGLLCVNAAGRSSRSPAASSGGKEYAAIHPRRQRT